MPRTGQSHLRFRVPHRDLEALKVVQLLYRLTSLRKWAEMPSMEQIQASPLGLSTSQAAHALGVSLGTIDGGPTWATCSPTGRPGDSVASARSRSTASSARWREQDSAELLDRHAS